MSSTFATSTQQSRLKIDIPFGASEPAVRLTDLEEGVLRPATRSDAQLLSQLQGTSAKTYDASTELTRGEALRQRQGQVKTSGVLLTFTGDGKGFGDATGDGSFNLSMTFTNGNAFKPTFTQATDISDFGSLRDVAGLVVPGARGVMGLKMDERVVEASTRDTGTVAGDYTPRPRTYYGYDFELKPPSPETPGTRVKMVLAALNGKVLVVVGTSSESGERAPEFFNQIVSPMAESFRIT